MGLSIYHGSTGKVNASPRHRQSVQRSYLFAACKSFVGSRRLVHSLLGQRRNNSVHLRIDALDPGQMSFHACLQPANQFENRTVRIFEAHKAGLRATQPDCLQGRDKLDIHLFQVFVGLINVVDGKSDPASSAA